MSTWEAGSPVGVWPDRWRDLLPGASLVVAVVVELVVRDDVTWRPALAVLGAVLVAAVVVRRRRPLVAVAAAFTGVVALDVASLATDRAPVQLWSGVVVLLLVGSLTRWAGRSQVLVGAGLALLGWAVGSATDATGPTDVAGGLAVLLLAAAAGLLLRYRGVVRAQRLDAVRQHEREVLARELHDTVAHHVTAIAVQAQAGGVLAEVGDVVGAAGALRAIEDEATRAMTEMRSVVGTLRDPGSSATLRPGVAAIAGLAGSSGGLTVEVETAGDVEGLSPAVGAALFRVAQEAVTNARRHARDAQRVLVVVTCDPREVGVRVSDDGAPVRAGAPASGFGLVGMAERVAVLGGTMESGPGAERGWTVHVVVPRSPRLQGSS